MNLQGEFTFQADGPEEGFAQWVALRKSTGLELAGRLGLPLGHPVEVWLAGEVRLRGLLRLKEEWLFLEEDRVSHLELVVDGVSFTMGEMASCVRLD